jgi:putative membrane protein (TIGR04086 family)
VLDLKKCKKIRPFCFDFCMQIIGAVTVGLVIVVGFAALFSSFITSFDCPEEIEDCAGAVAVSIGSFCAGFIISRQRRRKGLFLGIICGLLIYAAVFCISAFFLGWIAEVGFFGKMFIVILCGGVGGVIGVNTKLKRPCKC